MNEKVLNLWNLEQDSWLRQSELRRREGEDVISDKKDGAVDSITHI